MILVRILLNYLNGITYENETSKGAWMAQTVKCPALDLSSGHDRTICEFKPHVRLCTDGVEPAWDSASPSLCPSPACALSLSLSRNKSTQKN